MKKSILFFAFLLATLTSFAQTSTYVKGYSKSNGTYVQGHYRTSPNTTITSCYSAIGNVNLNTGKAGTLPGDGGYTATSSYTSSSYVVPVTTYSPKYYPSSSYEAPSSSASVTVQRIPRKGEYYTCADGTVIYIRGN